MELSEQMRIVAALSTQKQAPPLSTREEYAALRRGEFNLVSNPIWADVIMRRKLGLEEVSWHEGANCTSRRSGAVFLLPYAIERERALDLRNDQVPRLVKADPYLMLLCETVVGSESSRTTLRNTHDAIRQTLIAHLEARNNPDALKETYTHLREKYCCTQLPEYGGDLSKFSPTNRKEHDEYVRSTLAYQNFTRDITYS